MKHRELQLKQEASRREYQFQLEEFKKKLLHQHQLQVEQIRRRTDEKAEIQANSAFEQLQANSVQQELLNARKEVKEARDSFHPRLREETV